MPVKVSDNLPAIDILERENIFVMTENRALKQDIRPIKILLLNLMPTKIATETQILRLLSNTPLQIELELLQTSTYQSKNTSKEHLTSFYKTFDEVKETNFDGLIITGAPVEMMEFEEVDYWEELCEIMEWSKTNVHSTFYICWAAQAGLYYHFGIPKYTLDKKLSGIYKHKLLNPKSRLFRGFDSEFTAPHSRNTDIKAEDVLKVSELKLMSVSDTAGVYIVGSKDSKHFFVTGHSEYDVDTLSKEYFRDLGKGINPDVPENYFTDNDPTKPPIMSWRSHSTLLFTNWLNYFVYQTTPYDLKELKKKK